MSEIDFHGNLIQLWRQKQVLEYQKELVYKKMNGLHHELNKRFALLYPFLNRGKTLLYDILDVDFYFGEIVCKYQGENYNLFNKLAEFCDYIADVNVFDLSLSQLIKIYNLLVLLHYDFGYHEFCFIDKSLYNCCTFNSVIDKIRKLTESFEEKENVPKELVTAVQSLYMLVDFGLYDDIDRDDLRSLHSLYIDVYHDSYDRISKYDNELYKINEKIETLEEQTTVSTQEQRPMLSDEQNEKISIKEKLTDALGTFGVILFMLVRLTVSVLPFVMIDGNFFVTFLLIGLQMFLPFTTAIFWIWGLVCAINGIQDVFAIVYYIVFVVVWIPFYISTITSFFKNK